MRLALFTDTFDPDINGVARTLGSWVAYLKRRGVPCMVFAPDSSRRIQPPPSHDVERFMSLPFFLYPECRLALPNPRHIRRALESFRPTLIHVATPFNLGLCGVHYARKYQIPLIASYHTHFDRYLPFYNLQWMVKMLERYMHWFHQDCRTIFVPSQSTLRELLEKGWEKERLDVWTRGMDTRAFHPFTNRNKWLAGHGIDGSRFVILYTGRLAPEKNIGTAFDAFRIFQQGICPEALLVVAGDGPAADALKERCGRESIPVKFLGFTGMPDLQQWYAAADIFLFPSGTETFGNVVLEAMACGTPPVVADAGGVTDTVKHGVNGLRCDPGSPVAFADALSLLYRQPDLRRALAASGRAYSMLQSWDNIFAGLLAKCGNIEAFPKRSLFRHIEK